MLEFGRISSDPGCRPTVFPLASHRTFTSMTLFSTVNVLLSGEEASRGGG